MTIPESTSSIHFNKLSISGFFSWKESSNTSFFFCDQESGIGITKSMVRLIGPFSGIPLCGACAATSHCWLFRRCACLLYALDLLKRGRACATGSPLTTKVNSFRKEFTLVVKDDPVAQARPRFSRSRAYNKQAHLLNSQ